MKNVPPEVMDLINALADIAASINAPSIKEADTCTLVQPQVATTPPSMNHVRSISQSRKAKAPTRAQEGR